jgi:hypothetical protein
MVRRGRVRHRRFTVTVDEEVHKRLMSLAREHKPPLSLTYVTQYALNLLLQRADDPQFVLDFRDPTRRKASDGQH